ncbi:major capsid protein P2 [Roseateles microcysteis]|uniref:major capsid protein P2 n=1 Tax=Roseateles microcysteis TaxID=3119057 RepID=UPI002FE5C322
MSVGKLTRYGLPFANVVATGTATNNITPGRTLENFKLKLAGTALTKAMLTAIKIKANGKVIIEGTGTELDKINAYRGDAANAAYLDIPFADYSLNNEFDRMVSAFDTSIGIANITTEVSIAGATAPILTPIVTEAAAQKSQGGEYQPFAPLLAKILKYPYNISSGGKLPITVPFGPQNGAIIKRVHVFHGGNMTGATVKQDGLVVHESIAAENQQEQTRQKRVPQANVYTIDFVVDGDVRKALDTRDARSLEWLFDFSAADTGSVIVEYIDVLGNL